MFFIKKATLCKAFKQKLYNLKQKIKQNKMHPILQMLTLSTMLVFLLEMLSRRSISKGLGFITANPLMFLYNALIILLTLSATMMFPRKRFLLAFMTALWLGLGVANFVLLRFRTTPLGAMDFYMLKSVIGITKIYFNKLELILISIAFAIVAVGMFWLWRKLEKSQVQLRIPLISLCCTTVLLIMLSNISLKVNALSTNYGNLADAYTEYGFAYCFSNSIFDRGISKPYDYSEESIEAILQSIEGRSSKIAIKDKDLYNVEGNNYIDANVLNNRPNIIMVQLESFFDVNQLLDYSFSQNPVPNFTQLKKAYSHGYLTVPSIGAGTANTEFEVLTGMNVGHFGAGEYPYKTIMQKTTTESICYNLAELGYQSHAIHNNTGTFYQRNTVYPKLGFDSFSSIEYMNSVQYNPIGWAKDSVLTTEIIKALNARDTRDFIYTVSVQPHGKYPSKVVDENQKIKVTVDYKKGQFSNVNTDISSIGEANFDKKYTEKVDFDESYKNKLEYFVNQLAETDRFVGDLIDKLSVYTEPTVVVFFGDHLPSLSFENGDLVNHNKFQTEYIIWSNFPMERIYRDLNAYQLSAYVMERLGFENGLLAKFHQRYADESDYQQKLKLLQYDMLYGYRNVYKGENPYVEKTIQMGVFEVKIKNVIGRGEVVLIEGENFTPWSVAYIDGKPKETVFIDENTLIVYYEKLTYESIYVAQVSDNNTILSQSREWK